MQSGGPQAHEVSAQNDMAGAPAQMSERPWSEWLEDIRQLLLIRLFQENAMGWG